jgi:hypothetical protein
MKTINFFVILFLFSFATFCKEKENSREASTKKVDIEKHWASDSSGYGYQLDLDPTGKLHYFFAGEGCGNLTGTYTATESGFTYNLDKSEQECDTLRPGTGDCKVFALDDDLYFLKKIQCIGVINIELFGSPIETELPRKIGNILVKTIHKSGKVTTEAFIREAPQKSAKPARCILESPRLEERKTLPKDAELKVVARTNEKEKVDKWENYWYYVDAKDGWYANCEGWVFGEFVEIK